MKKGFGNTTPTSKKIDSYITKVNTDYVINSNKFDERREQLSHKDLLQIKGRLIVYTREIIYQISITYVQLEIEYDCHHLFASHDDLSVDEIIKQISALYALSSENDKLRKLKYLYTHFTNCKKLKKLLVKELSIRKLLKNYKLKKFNKPLLEFYEEHKGEVAKLMKKFNSTIDEEIKIGLD